MAGKTKIKLAELLLDLFGDGYYIDPEELIVNKGGNQFNDWCSWTGIIYEGRTSYSICSWVTMGELVKNGKVRLVSNEIKRLGVNEIA